MELYHLKTLRKPLERARERLTNCKKSNTPEASLVYSFTIFEAALQHLISIIAKSNFKKVLENQIFTADVINSSLLNPEKYDLEEASLFTTTVNELYTTIFIEKCKWKSPFELLSEISKLINVKFQFDSKAKTLNEYRKLRNNLVHHDLKRNELYPSISISRDDDDRYVFKEEHISQLISTMIDMFLELEGYLNKRFSKYDDAYIIQSVWDDVFEKKYKLTFEECWNMSSLVTYRGPSPEDYAENIGSPRVACLLSFFLSGFNQRSIIGYDHVLFGLTDEDKNYYLEKINTIIKMQKHIDLQSMSVDFKM